MYRLPFSPDCREGKHLACDETAWDDEMDELCGCGCDCHAARTIGPGE